MSKYLLDIENLEVRFGDFVALKGVSLTAKRGEFLTLLGSSGSGKSTLLRTIAGFEAPHSVSKMELNGVPLATLPSNKRDVTTVFQHYGLFPHMSVGENVEYGLKLRKVSESDCTARARRMLSIVQLGGSFDKRVSQLSGGQKQRVALARSLVLNPSVLLLDEPLGALDEKLRIEMQIELQQLQRSLEMTFIYVTHSQEEALTMSDRIMLMHDGRIEQSGTPIELFDSPRTRFAAEFMGIENILTGRLMQVKEGVAEVDVNGHRLRGRCSGELLNKAGQDVFVAFRAENTRSARLQPIKDAQANTVSGHKETSVYKGKYRDYSYGTALGSLRLRIWDKGVELEESEELRFLVEDTIVGIRT